MASALTSAGKDLLLDSSASWPPGYLSVHNVDGPTDNTTEPSGGSPAYARKAASWSASSGGTKTLSATVTFDIPAAFTVKSVGFWTAVSGGTLIGYWDVTDESFASQGTYTVAATSSVAI